MDRPIARVVKSTQPSIRSQVEPRVDCRNCVEKTKQAGGPRWTAPACFPPGNTLEESSIRRDQSWLARTSLPEFYESNRRQASSPPRESSSSWQRRVGRPRGMETIEDSFPRGGRTLGKEPPFLPRHVDVTTDVLFWPVRLYRLRNASDFGRVIISGLGELSRRDRRCTRAHCCYHMRSNRPSLTCRKVVHRCELGGNAQYWIALAILTVVLRVSGGPLLGKKARLL